MTGEWFYHPDRLKFPRKRVGEKGQNKWERISWDQALVEAANAVTTHALRKTF